MRFLTKLAMLCLFACTLLTSCSKEGTLGATIASQVTGTFMSTSATIVVDGETILDKSEDYSMTITEVDANTVSVITEHASAFEVNLTKSDNGDRTEGKTNSAGAGFTFIYYVGEGTIELSYANNGVAIEYEGAKE